MLGSKNRKALETEDYEERRRKWRRSGFWRGIGFVFLLFALLIALVFVFGDRPRFGPHLAQIDIEGVIVDDPILDAKLAEIQDNDDVKGVILRINSPGGTTVGSEALYERVRAISEKKPVVVTMGEVAASGGYITAIAADHIIARGNTITGSIGVILEYPQIGELLEKIGVEIETVKSDSLKGGPSIYRSPSPEELELEKALIEDSYQWFRGLVADRRGLTDEALNAVADGRVFTGRQALEVGLIDALGGYDDALDWLDSHDSVSADLPVDRYAPDYPEDGILGQVGNFLTKNIGLTGLSRASGPRLYSLTR
ncbi:MAG: signal peptide peptidase SppA [Pseudomonadota bacterium]